MMRRIGASDTLFLVVDGMNNFLNHSAHKKLSVQPVSEVVILYVAGDTISVELPHR